MNQRIFLSSVALVFVIFLIFKNDDVAKTQIFKGSIMGTGYSISLQSEVSSQNTHFKAFNILQNVNQEMSTYLDDSLISKVNKAEVGIWVTVTQDFIEVLDYALALCEETQGIYDVSIGKLVNLWGFGPDEVYKEPSEEEVSYLSSQVGCGSVILDSSNLLVKKVKDIELDFSSIAKGFAIDKVYKFLEEQQNIKSFFIEIGGEIRSTSLKSNDQPWKAGIVNPSDQDKIIYTFLSSSFDSFALATSGDYRNIRILDEKEFSHTMNTFSGLPSSFSKKSVTVISENAMKADALATALNAMKLEQAINYSNKEGIKALFITEIEGQTKLLFSDDLEQVKI